MPSPDAGEARDESGPARPYDPLADARAEADVERVAMPPSRLRFVKRVVARVARVVTHQQAAYNQAMIEALAQTRERVEQSAALGHDSRRSVQLVGERLADALGEVQSTLTSFQLRLDEVATDSKLASEQVAILGGDIEKLNCRIEELGRGVHEMRAAREADQRELRIRTSVLAGIARDLRGSGEAREGGRAAGAELDDELYRSFEDVFRGDPVEVKERLRVYLPDVATRGGIGPAVDLGSGRGEWLELMAAEGVEAYGVDINRASVESATARGLRVVDGDALSHLRSLPDASVSLVTAFHLVEHLPFYVLVSMIDETLRVLAPGGMLIVETPNANNVLVGASRFHLDPTHLKPVLPEVLDFVLRQRGFRDVEIRPLQRYDAPVAWPAHPADVMEALGPALTTLNALLFGPEDYGAIAFR